MSETLAIAVLVLLAVVRFGLPVLVLVGLAYALDRMANRWEMEEFVPTAD